ncbi:MAG: DUF4294 domain-containing protein [Ferruginibacter sp.]
MIRRLQYKTIVIFLLIFLFSIKSKNALAQYGKNDTLTLGAIIVDGDTLPFRTLDDVSVYGWMTKEQSQAYAQAREAWTQLRNAVYVTYPYAKRASVILNDINAHLANIPDESDRKKYIKSREKELKREFEAPITNLTIYQGKILMKLINRETGNNCYDIIKEYKGGLTARLYQTVAFFFDSNLKQPYDPNGDDAQMEKIVLEVRRMYGYKS